MVSKKVFYICSLIAVFIWIGGSGPAQGQEPLSFYGAITKALENNYQIQLAEGDLTISKNNNTPGAAGMWPSISLSAGQENSINKTTTPQDQTTRVHSVGPSVNLNWLIFGGFSVQINRKRLAELQNLSQGLVSLVVENTLQSVILGYHKALLEKERLQVTRKLMKLSYDQYQYVLAKRKTGNATTFDLQQAKTAYLQDSSNFILQGMNYRNAMRNLNLLMGEDHATDYELTGEFKPVKEPLTLEMLFEKLASNNQTLQNQYINQKLVKYSLEQSKSALYPTFSLNAGSGYTYQWTHAGDIPVQNTDPLMAYGNFTLSFNLFNGGQVKRSIQNAKIELEQSNLEIEEMEKSLKAQLANSYDLYNVRQQLYEVAVENEKLTQMSFELAKKRFELGTMNSINFREVQLNYMNASLQKLQSVYDMMMAYTEILRSTGTILSEFDPGKK